MRARDIMTSPVICVRPETSVREAAEVLTKHRFAALPVVDDDSRLIGIVAEADLIRDRIPTDPRAHIWRAEGSNVEKEAAPGTVGEVMTKTVVAMTAGADVADIAEHMLEHKVRSMPIVDGSRLLGIVSRQDLVRTMVRTDDAVAADVRRRLRAYADSWEAWKVDAKEGVVTVHWDPPGDDDIAKSVLIALARTVPGVSRVHVVAKGAP
ncbi:CBS domain-containing protein [Allokutzneria albata]|uniref:CBS domain-containing protein n=1 Tax=Allokutzneria albata TaxID=211114 RepID=A0A1G9SK27_ALLAB|nr:CBS domain-containing protein [Allokutzneria albata]SDM35761.1 CBS domain-containing protein [Allokutzneria albata]